MSAAAGRSARSIGIAGVPVDAGPVRVGNADHGHSSAGSGQLREIDCQRDVEDRLRSIREQIMSRSRLERIIQDLDLYKDRRSTGDDGRRRAADAR